MRALRANGALAGRPEEGASMNGEKMGPDTRERQARNVCRL